MTLSKPQKASSTVNGAEEGRGRLICHLRPREEEGRGGKEEKGERSHNISVVMRTVFHTRIQIDNSLPRS